MEKNCKYGFTLAEILIVLTIIGVMAVMTIPSLMQNANSQHKIALFKKAYNAISNAYATEFATKTPPAKGSDYKLIFDALVNQLNVKYYQKQEPTNDGQKYFNYPLVNDFEPWQFWINTEDGMAFDVTIYNSDTVCQSKLTVNSKTTQNELEAATCSYILVDIDGRNNGSNTLCKPDEDIDNFNCDMVMFYVTTQGIATGNPSMSFFAKLVENK